MPEILDDSNWMPQLCPACKRPLASARIATGYVVWCPRSDCRELADGPNEGGHGRSIEKAYSILMTKLGLSKTYEAEPSEETVDTDSVSTKETAKTPKAVKKGGKRGRKAKECGPFTIPVGEFTMGEFCVANDTYPYKALPFFKEKGVKEVGKRPTASGRGKPAVLYAVAQ